MYKTPWKGAGWVLNNPSSESLPKAPYTSFWQEKLGTAGLGKLRLPRQRR